MALSTRYGALSRALHRLALSDLRLQRSLASLEDRLFRIGAEVPAPRKPVFICSLPRAGTTVLLEVLYRCGEFNSHTYRHMPFVLTPLLWPRLSRWARREITSIERAHADGLEINFDSPEAFEEILWMAFYARRYALANLPIWTEKAQKKSFTEFFSRHIFKLGLSDESSDEATPKRYLSKNNANIGRLRLLPVMFPDCQIIVPFRTPGAHIASLVRQHARFSEMHAQDRFALNYMRWIGHFDFGQRLKPLNFANWRDEPNTPALGSEHFWSEYWKRAYTDALELHGESEHLVFFDLDQARRDPDAALFALGTRLGVRDISNLCEQSGLLRRAEQDSSTVAEQLNKLYGNLCSIAVNAQRSNGGKLV